MSKIKDERNAVLISLLTNKAIRVNHSCKWFPKKAGLPSLRDAVVYKLYQANLVCSQKVDGIEEVVLTSTGKLVATRLQSA